MLFDKAVRRRQLNAMGFHGLDFGEQQITAGRSDLLLAPKSIRQDFMKSLEWPPAIRVRLRWRAIPFEGLFTAQETVNEYAHKLCDIYDPGASNYPFVAKYAKNKGIELIITDLASLLYPDHETKLTPQLQEEMNLCLPFAKKIFEKTVSLPPMTQMRQIRTKAPAGGWFVTTLDRDVADLNIVALFGYGLYVADDGLFKDIEQIFASISSQETQGTKIRLYKRSYLSEIGVIQPHGGKDQQWTYRFLPADRISSLVEDIVNKKILIPLRFGDEERHYVSTSFEEVGRGTQMIDVTLIPQEGKE